MVSTEIDSLYTDLIPFFPPLFCQMCAMYCMFVYLTNKNRLTRMLLNLPMIAHTERFDIEMTNVINWMTRDQFNYSTVAYSVFFTSGVFAMLLRTQFSRAVEWQPYSDKKERVNLKVSAVKWRIRSQKLFSATTSCRSGSLGYSRSGLTMSWTTLETVATLPKEKQIYCCELFYICIKYSKPTKFIHISIYFFVLFPLVKLK